MDNRLKLSLLENVFDYLLKAAEDAKSESPRDWKYATLHLFAGIELLLKARIEKEHWSLLFADVNKASKSSLASGDFLSVDFTTAINRLNGISDVALDPARVKTLNELRGYRNRVQHFAVDVDKATITSLMAHGYDFAVDFIHSQLSQYLDDKAKLQTETLVMELSGFKDFVKTRMERIKGDLKAAESKTACARCFNETLILGSGDPRCAFCHYTDTPSNAAGDSGLGRRRECPACFGPCVNLDDDYWLCYKCGVGDEYQICDFCNELYFDNSDRPLCDSCHESHTQSERGD